MSPRMLLVIRLISVIRQTASFPDDVYKAEYKWIEKGDINIGAILSIHSPNSLLNCTSDIQDMRNVQNVEALSFAVQEINNKRSDLLPNLKLGFAILDDCLSPSIALARAIQFMPSGVRFRDMCDGSAETCQRNEANSNDTDFFDVVGVIGTYTSKLSIVVADVLNLFKIPQISHTATSNVLSDKTRFPYFFRMVPPDRYQVMVMVSLLRHFNWTHVSIVYSEGSYGREGVKELDSILQQKGSSQICIEDKIELLYNSGDTAFDCTLQKLNKHLDTRVVIAFVEIQDAVLLTQAIKRSGMMERFVWIGSDSFSLVLKESPDSCHHLTESITVEPYSRNIERFAKHITYIQTEQGRRENKNPWLKEITAKKVSNLKNSNTTQRLHGTWGLPGDEDGYIQSSFVDTFLIDSVYAFAYALDNVVRKYCNDWQLRPTEDVSRCISRVGIFNELKHINFNGSLGKLKFNENGDIMSKYVIRQCQTTKTHQALKQVGFWDMSDERLDIKTRLLSWSGDKVPVSACPKPCTAILGTIYYFAKQTCCWECMPCKPNEIVTTNATRCEVCPELQWPNQHRATCESITPVYFGMTNAISVGLCTAAVSGILVCLWISGVLFKYRDEHVVKCTSLELSSMIIMGTMLTFALTGSFLSQPNSIKCYVNQVGFSLVFTIIYAPLLVKTNRIYRIFNAGRRTTRKPCFISKSSQVLISLIMIFLQVAIVIITTSLEPPELRLQMPSKTEKFVELFCYLPQAGLLSSLCYNLVLVLFCTFYAFKTRKLPDNYKESRYIAYCVDTTLLIWVTFLPTYFTTSRAAAKLTILAASLLLNASVTITCLFIPRVYSLYKTLRNPCSTTGHHYKDFRIVKHVVKRNRSLVEVKDEENLPRVMSSAATIASDIVVKEYNDAISLTTVAPTEISTMLNQCHTLEETGT